VSFLSGGSWTSDPRGHEGQRLIQKRRSQRTDRLADATIACDRCDAPVAVGPEPLTLTDTLTCPFCGRHGPVRDFLSLAVPTRPTHVVLRVSFGGESDSASRDHRRPPGGDDATGPAPAPG
jgi:hypothetical protein